MVPRNYAPRSVCEALPQQLPLAASGFIEQRSLVLFRKSCGAPLTISPGVTRQKLLNYSLLIVPSRLIRECFNS